MILKKDSLLFRIITYNGIAIVLLSTIMALLFGIMTVNEINKRLLDKSREKVNILNKAYTSFIEKSERDLFNSVTNALNIMSLSNEIDVQAKLAEVVKNQLNLESYSRYNKSFIQTITEKRKVLSESGSREIKYDILGYTEIVPFVTTMEAKSYYFVGTNKNLYVRIIQPYRINNSFEKNYIILTFPLSNYSMLRVREYTDLKKDDRIFILSKNHYIYGELGDQRIDNFLKINKNIKSSENIPYNDYYFSEREVNKESYYLALNSLENEEGIVVGQIGIAISKSSFLAIKYMLATMILAISLISVIISTALCARIFAKLLNPLSILADKTKEIGEKNIDMSFEEEAVYEIRTIASSIKTMTERIATNEKLLISKNQKLNTNLNRIATVENILMGMDIDKDYIDSMEKFLRALTSEIGMGYSRAIYLEYNEEKNKLYSKELSLNSFVLSNIDEYTQGVGGFSFQIKDLKKLLPLLKVNYEPGNLFWESINSGKIIFHNDKGYKFNFGNELFKSLGFSNFMILPISDKEVKIGCILVDYFGKDNCISEEEVEVLTLLLMNLIIRIKNNLQEEKKLTNEKVLTMSKVSKKFLDENKKMLDKVESFIEKITNQEYNNKDIEKINAYITEQKRQNSILKEILNNSEINFKAINLERMLTRIIRDYTNITNKYGINISLFTDFSGFIYGNKKKIYQMFSEIIKNSMEAILIRNKLDKKINITLTSEEAGRVTIEISDNGIGMDQSELNQLKKPYSEDKKDMLGLGMTTIFSIVREHKGIITISSELDEGTKIRIIFNEYREEK